MAVSFAVACFFQFGSGPCGLDAYLTSGGRAEWFDLSAWKLVLGIVVTTAAWLAVTFLTPREPEAKLAAFRAKIGDGVKGEIPRGILCTVIGCVAVWSCLFGTGWLLYAAGGKTEFLVRGCVAMGVAVVATVSLLTLVGARKSATRRIVT